MVPTATMQSATSSSAPPRDVTPPTRTSSTARRRSASRSLATMSSVTTAPANDEMTMPASRTVSTVVRPPIRARRQMTATDASAPTNAATGASSAGPPAATAATEPSAAPADVPVTYGSASGLRSRPWRSAPATPSAPPTSAAAMTRGSRSSRMIAVVGASAPPVSAASPSPGSTATAPASTPSSALAASARRSAPSAVAGRTNRTTGNAPLAEHGRVKELRVRLGCLAHARSRPAREVRGDRIDPLAPDRRDAGPAGACRDLLRRDAVVRVGQDDDLWIRTHELLGGELRVRTRRASRDIHAAGELDEIVNERSRPDRERLRGVGGVDLVEDPRLRRDRRGPLLHGLEPARDVVGELLPVGPDSLADERRAARDVAETLRVDHEHDRTAGREALDRSVAELDRDHEIRTQLRDLLEVHLHA